jgi:hypothetical protein
MPIEKKAEKAISKRKLIARSQEWKKRVQTSSNSCIQVKDSTESEKEALDAIHTLKKFEGCARKKKHMHQEKHSPKRKGD